MDPLTDCYAGLSVRMQAYFSPQKSWDSSTPLNSAYILKELKKSWIKRNTETK